ncbi:STAS-like domain-containing protein [Pseudomonas viridiflava]|uniref:STAS-like domain-containing protein n=1 Tax=Pseudomonas syringae group TaxID=136849 RepID=UPI000F02ECF2|nr:STAS-like domain-containing protein [Pseudomonas viridiflava]
MSPQHTIFVATEFGDMPHGRNGNDGLLNGERFRKQFLMPALEEHEYVLVDFDGAKGCGSSFADESFAGLIDHEGWDKAELTRRVTYKFRFKSVLRNIYKYIDEAEARRLKKC